MNSNVIRENITKRIVDALKKGVVPWRRMWRNDPNSGFPASIKSKANYRGINPILLELTSLERDYKSRWWATLKQWNELGGKVKKGEKSTQIVFYKPLSKKRLDLASKKEVTDKFFVMKGYNVFNLEQVEGEKLDKYRPVADAPAPINQFADYALAQKVIDNTGAGITHGGNKAFYKRPLPDKSWPKHTSGDEITVPSRRQFTDLRSYYDTVFHELGHWSEVRLGWNGSYAMGELIAEITACNLATECNIPQSEEIENHASYLKSWLEGMAGDVKFIFKAAAQAGNVTDYIMSFTFPERKKKTEEEEEVEEAA